MACPCHERRPWLWKGGSTWQIPARHPATVVPRTGTKDHSEPPTPVVPLPRLAWLAAPATPVADATSPGGADSRLATTPTCLRHLLPEGPNGSDENISRYITQNTTMDINATPGSARAAHPPLEDTSQRLRTALQAKQQRCHRKEDAGVLPRLEQGGAALDDGVLQSPGLTHSCQQRIRGCPGCADGEEWTEDHGRTDSATCGATPVGSDDVTATQSPCTRILRKSSCSNDQRRPRTA